MPNLSVDLAGLKLANPTLTCSGTCGYAFEYADFMDLSRLGAFVTKSITREERAGNEPARIVETRAGMLNAIGLANVGLKRFLAEKVPLLKKMPCPVVVNVAGHSFDDYIETCAAMDGLDCVGGVELNVSCPNVKDGLTFGTHPGRLKELTCEVKKALPHKPLMVKLSPNVEDITLTARAAVEGGADVLTLVNTFTAMAIDIHKRRPRLANVTGGLSGPAIKPIALHLVSRVYRNVTKQAKVPIVGMGGVQYWQDAAEFILAGATAVAIGTALFVDPSAPNHICDGLNEWLTKQGVERLSDLVGALELPGDESRGRRRIRELSYTARKNLIRDRINPISSLSDGGGIPAFGGGCTPRVHPLCRNVLEGQKGNMRLSAELFEQIIEALKSDAHSDRDKRLEPRVGMAGEATLVSLSEDGRRRSQRVRVRDVSHSGIGLYHNKRLASGQKFIIQLQSYTREPIWLVCISAYCRKQEQDRFSVGARISQVLRSEQIRKLEEKAGDLAACAAGGDRQGDGMSLFDRATVDRISKMILS